LIVIRPGDANEVAEAYRVALSQTSRPTALVLTRQNVPTLDRTEYGSAAGVAKGAYVLAEAKGGGPAAIIMATGSELPIALEAYERLTSEGVNVRLVSMPSWELFDEQDDAYRESVLPASVNARVAVEAGIAQGWERYLGPGGRFIGMSGFGASAPYQKLYQHFGITAEAVAQNVKACLTK
jgi:transketolase